MTPPRLLQGLAGALAWTLCVGAAAPSVAPTPGEAKRIVDTGVVAHGVPACASCHGFGGEGVPVQNGPRLANLNADCLERQLANFASGDRRHGVMGPIAHALSADQRASLAAYFAALSLPAPSSMPPAPAAQAMRGRTLALTGDWSRGAPPCGSCHGPDGEGVGSVAPPLVGQTEAYLLRQLTAFRDGDRKGPLGLMEGIAKRLPRSDLRAAAAYYASLRPTPLEPARTP
jgi:cytochrome c553